MGSGNVIIRVDGSRIHDEKSLHESFYDLFGFPGWHGRNWNAWIDCMYCLDDPKAGMTSLTVKPGSLIVLQIENQRTFKTNCPDVFDALVECSAWVNWSRIKEGYEPVLALSFHT